MRNPSICTLDQPEAIAAISFFGELMNSGLAMRDADLSQAGGDASVFQSGEAAMIIQNNAKPENASPNRVVAKFEGHQTTAPSGRPCQRMTSYSSSMPSQPDGMFMLYLSECCASYHTLFARLQSDQN